MDSSTYRVRSQSGNGTYLVVRTDEGWRCECSDHTYRGVKCKHILSVKLSSNLREKVASSDEVFKLRREAVGVSECVFCGSLDVMRYGTRKTKNGKVQSFKGKRCGHRFTVNQEGFEKIRIDPKVVTLALDLYMKGVSYREIADTLKQFFDVEVHHTTIIYWLKKYTAMINEYLESFIPQLGDVWNTDEMKVKADGEWVWLWNVMDSDTRFLISSLVSKKREIKDAGRVFSRAKRTARRDDPKVMVTDGLPAYIKAFKKEFFTLKKPRVKHVRMPRFTDEVNNNIIERLQGTIRERDKVMRGNKGESNLQELADGIRTYYNFIRPHQSLNGKTPAEEAGINLELGRNKWLSLIKKSLGN